MTKARNLIFLLVALVIFLSLLGTRALDAAGVVFAPGSDINQNVSNLEGRSYAESPTLTVDAVAAGTYQTDIETYLSDRLPLREHAMLLNANLQRLGISQGALVAGFDAYPTTFTSKYLHVASQNAVVTMPTPNVVEHHEYHLQQFAEKLVAQADSYPEKTFIVYLVPGYQEPAFNPAYKLVNNAFTTDVAIRIFSEEFEGHNNVHLVSPQYASAEDYYQDYYRSDHHWNARGALKAYNAMAEYANIPQVDIDGLSLKTFPESYYFLGANSRAGLDCTTDTPFDYNSDYSQVTYYSEGQLLTGNDHTGFDANNPTFVYSFYDNYYNDIPDGTLWGPGTGSALLICNSYGGGVQRQLALQYERLERAAVLWPDYVGGNFDQLMEKSDADTIFFVANPTNYIDADYFFPGFFM